MKKLRGSNFYHPENRHAATYRGTPSAQLSLVSIFPSASDFSIEPHPAPNTYNLRNPTILPDTRKESFRESPVTPRLRRTHRNTDTTGRHAVLSKYTNTGKDTPFGIAHPQTLRCIATVGSRQAVITVFVRLRFVCLLQSGSSGCPAFRSSRWTQEAECQEVSAGLRFSAHLPESQSFLCVIREDSVHTHP